ncbi:AfsA-related hotdog domain-containing protein [Streptomyces sp. NPDC054786]
MTTSEAHQAPADLNDPAAGFSLVSWESMGEHRFEVRARYTHGRQPLALAHAVRQSALLVAHEAYGIPRGHHCVFRSVSCMMPADAAGPPSALEPGVEVSLGLRLDPELRRGQLVGARFRADVVNGASAVGRAEVDFAFLSPAVYRFVRRSARDGGGEEARETGAAALELKVTDEQLTFRGLTVDHIPGMVLAGAALEAAAQGPGPVRTPVGLTGTFTGYTTPDEPCAFYTRPAPEPDAADGGQQSTTEVWAVQSGRRVFEGTVRTPQR